MQKEQLITKIAKAINLELYDNKEYAASLPPKRSLAEAKAALAAIQEGYVIVEKWKVELVDNDNITPHVGDIIKHQIFRDGKLLLENAFILDTLDYDWEHFKQRGDKITIYSRNGKAGINKTNIIGE